MIKNILIPLDGSEHSTAALDYGMWTAEKFNGTLFGQHVIDTISIEGTFFHDISGSLGFEPYLDFSTKMREVLEERGKIILEDFPSDAAIEGSNIRLSWTWASLPTRSASVPRLPIWSLSAIVESTRNFPPAF
jgi:hypothetical protein